MIEIGAKGERLKLARKKLGLTQTEIAEVLGITQSAIGRAEKGMMDLKSSNLKKLYDHFKINIEYIETGKGAMIDDLREEMNSLSKVRLISGSVLAGLSASVGPQDYDVKEIFFMPLKKQKEYFAIKVQGRSMEPQIREGSTLIIERLNDKSDFINNKIYVIIFDGIAFVKRIQMLLGGNNKGKFEVSSDNEDKIQVVDGDDIKSWYRVAVVLNQV